MRLLIRQENHVLPHECYNCFTPPALTHYADLLKTYQITDNATYHLFYTPTIAELIQFTVLSDLLRIILFSGDAVLN